MCRLASNHACSGNSAQPLVIDIAGSNKASNIIDAVKIRDLLFNIDVV
jgi:hypothetical protein